MPPKPSAAALRNASTGKISLSSQSRACGIISSRANCRAVAWNARCSLESSKSIGPPGWSHWVSNQAPYPATGRRARPDWPMLGTSRLLGHLTSGRAALVPVTGGYCMAQDDKKPSGPDLTLGIPSTDLADGAMLTGHIGGEEVLLVRQAGKISAVAAHCTHYHGPLADGLVVGNTIRCPWHHACFDLATGEALAAPAISPLTCWRVEERNGKIIVGAKVEPPPTKKTGAASERIVIVGGGAAGFAAAEMLRRRGFAGSVMMLSNDDAAPVDRPNLSKDYLAGSAPEEWVPLRGDDWYAENKIDLKLKTEVIALDPKAKELTLSDGSTAKFDKLLLATGAEPIKLPIPGGDQKHVHNLRSLDDSRAIIAQAKSAKRAVVIGASFIGLEV